MRERRHRNDGTCPDGFDCFGCRIQDVQVSEAAMPTRGEDRFVYRPPPDPAWERGLAGETRSDGSFMPILKPGTTTPMGLHEFQGKRSKIERQLKEMRQPTS